MIAAARPDRRGPGCALTALCVAATAWWTVAVIVEAPRDPAPVDHRRMCADLETAAAWGARTLPERRAAAQQAFEERGERVPVFDPPRCAPGWEAR